MTGESIALDTNQAIAILNAVGDSAEWIARYEAVFVPVPVLGELRFGMLNSRDADQNMRRLDEFTARVHVLPATADTTPWYAEVRARLKKAGTPIPENDVWIAAICRQNDLELATSDAHFDRVEGLRMIRRPSPS